MVRLSFIALLLCPVAALAEARTSELDKAARLVSDQKYEAAARIVAEAWRQTGNKREVVLRILELQGVVQAQLGQETKAKAAFQILLSLDPKRELSGKYGAKVLKPFSEAQGWANETPPLEVSAEPAAVDGSGKVLQIAVKVKSDSLKLARKMRFFVRADSGKWVEQLVEVQGAYASAGTDSDAIEWYAELLGEREMVLAHVASARAPVKEGRLREKEKPVAVVEKKPEDAPKKEKVVAVEKKPEDTPKREKPPEPARKKLEPVQEREPQIVAAPGDSAGGGSPTLRGFGYTFLAIGMAGVAGGTVMGGLWRMNADTLQSKMATAQLDGSGRVISYEGVSGSAQSYYFGMRDRLKVQAIAANVLWSAGGGLAILGVILYFAGRESTDVVAPGAGGIIVRW